MNSSRLILIFLGIIFILIIILSGSRIGGGLKNRLAGILARPTTTQDQDAQVQVKPTPTISEESTVTPTPSVTITNSTPSTETPATGPVYIFWITIVGGLIVSFWTNHKSKNLLK